MCLLEAARFRNNIINYYYFFLSTYLNFDCQDNKFIWGIIGWRELPKY